MQSNILYYSEYNLKHFEVYSLWTAARDETKQWDTSWKPDTS